MKANKSAFTMIELIFVIVILGILASVAIPKMQSVKDDATLANANENYCLNLKPFFLKEVAIKGSLVGMDITRYSDIVDGDTWKMAQSGGDKTSLKSTDVNSVDASSLKATFANSKNSVYVYLVDGNDSIPVGCYVSNSSTSSKSADDARALNGTNNL